MSKLGKKYTTGPTVGITLREEGELYNDVYSVEHGDFAMGTADYSGAGSLGTMNLPVTGQLDSMELTVNYRGLGDQIADLQRPGTHNFVINIVEDVLDAETGDVEANRHIKWSIKCVTKTRGGATGEMPNTIDGNFTYEVTRFEEYVDGAETIVIDKVNYIYRIKGTDYMDDIASML